MTMTVQPRVGTTLLLEGWHGTERWKRRRSGWRLEPSDKWIELTGISWWALVSRAAAMGTKLVLDGQQSLLGDLST